VMRDLWQYISLEPGEERAFRIYHQSFIDFLLDRERSQDHWIDPQFWNRRIAQFYYPTGFLTPSPPSGWDPYAVRNLAAHLAAGRLLPALFALVEDENWRRKKMETDTSGTAYAGDVELAVLAASTSPSMIAELFAYSLLFAAATEPFTAASRNRLAALVEEGRGQEALVQVRWIARPDQKAEGYMIIGDVFHRVGRARDAGAAWDLAYSAANDEGNPVRAAKAMQVLCLSLYEKREFERARRVLDGTGAQIRRIPADPSRLWQWASLAEGLLQGGRKPEAEWVVESLLSDMQVMQHGIYYHGGGDHEDPPYAHYMGVNAKCRAMETAARLAIAIDDRDWCASVLSRLESLVDTTPPDGERGMSYIGVRWEGDHWGGPLG
jgi:hypothetical protein